MTRSTHLLATLLSTVLLASHASAEDWRIGVTSPLTGPLATAAIGGKQGMELALEEFRKANPDQKVDVIFEDSQGRPEAGVNAAEKLIQLDHVNLLIGDAFSSSIAIAIMELSPKYGIPILSGEPVSSEITKKIKSDPERFKYFWKGNFNSDLYGQSVFQAFQSIIQDKRFVAKTKTIGFIIEDTDFGRANAAQIRKLFEAEGWTVPLFETVPVGYSDFYPQLGKARAAKPDILITNFSSVNSGVAMLKQFQELGVSSTHFAIFYPSLAETRPQAGRAAERLMWAGQLFNAEADGPQKEFAEKIRAKLNVVPTQNQAYGYCFMNIALGAMKRAASLDPKKISDAIGSTDYQCPVIGHWVFNQDDHSPKTGIGYITLPAIQIQDGKNVVFWPADRAEGDLKPQPWVR